MTRSLPRTAGLLAALALLAASPRLSAQKALVLCPPADASGCDRVVRVLAGTERAGGGTLFPGGVDRRFEDLRTAAPAEMLAYSLVFVPSFAGAPYDLLREAPVRERLGGILTGRVAVWSGTPDRGATAGASTGKLRLIENLARWAAADGSPGLVVLQDFSGPRADGTSRRYDWVRGVAGIEVSAVPTVKTYRAVRPADGGQAREIVGDLAYENMASFGLAAPADGNAIRAFGLEAPGGVATEDAVVLLAWDRSASGSVPATSASGPPTQLSITTQPTDSVQSGVAFAQQPTVQLRDASGNPVSLAGVTVTASIASGGGTLGGTVTATSDVSGVAAFTNLSIGGAAGDRTLSFSASGLTGATSSTVSVTAGAATQLTITTQPADSVQSGVAFAQQPTVQLRDASGNPVSQAGVTVTASIASGGGTLGGTVTATSDVSGVATFTNLSIGGTMGNRTLSFSASGLTGATSGTINVTAGPAAALAFSTQPSNVVASAAITPAVQVAVVDAFGNVVTGATDNVTLAIGTNPSGGTLSGTTTVGATGGVATFSNLSLNLVGSGYTLTASSGSLGGTTSVGFNVTHGPLDHFLVEAAGGGPIGNQLAGTPFNVRVTAQDAFNNTVTSFTGTVGFTSTPSGGISGGATSGAFTAGVLSSHGITFGTPGSFTLTATNSAGAQSGTSNSFDVQAPPTAVNEGPTPTSAPGQPFHAFFSTSGSPQTFTLSAPGVMSNDNLGFPLATITSFGADSLGGAVTTYPAGSTVSPLPGHASGSLSVGANGTITFTPPDGFTGNYVFRYRVSNTRGSSDARVTVAVGARPAAANDAYSPTLVVNVPINTATSTQFRVTSNDAGDGKTLAIIAQSNGFAALNPDSTFVFRPNRGFEGTASFTYTVTNGFGTSTPATVSMTVASPLWFVNAGAAPGGDGRFDAPYDNLPALAAVNNAAGSNPAANDRIFLYTGSYMGPLTLLSGQRLIGQGATASLSSIAGVTWPADAGPEPAMSGTAPTITSSGVDAITLANVGSATTANNTLRGFNLGNVGAAGTALAGTSFGTVTVSEVGINTNGRALSLTNGVINGNFAQVRSTGGTNNVLLTSVGTGGTNRALGTASDALSGATGDALRIDGGNGSFTYEGSITNTAALAVNVTGKTGGTVTISGPLNPAAAARGISVAGNTGGTVNFTGSAQKISTGTGAGVSLVGNTGATIGFTGGGLAIATTTGSGFSATGGGMMAVTGAANTITSAGGVALSVTSTTIGTGGLVFRSVSATGGSSGIVLNATGSDGGLTVTGSGVAGSGGTIQNTTGDAVSLTSTVDPSLSHVNVRNNAGSGIRASAVSGLSLAGSLVENNGDTTGGTEAGILLVNLSGTNQISASTIRGSFEDNVRWTPSSGAQALTVTNTTVGPNNPTSGNNGVNVVGSGTADATLNVSGGSFTQNRSFGIGTSFTNGAAHTVIVSGATFTDNNVAVGLATALNADLTFDIADNPGILRSRTDAIQVLARATSTSASQIRGRIRGNVIGDNTADSGARDGIGLRIEVNDDADAVIEVAGNHIRHTDGDGIFIQSRDPSTGDGDPATATVDLTVTGNTVGTPDDNSAFPLFGVRGIRIEGRHNTTTCLDLSGNVSSGVGAEHFQLRQRDPASVFKLERYAGVGTNDAAVAGFVRAENPYPGVTAAATHQGATGFTGVAAGTCRTP